MRMVKFALGALGTALILSGCGDGGSTAASSSFAGTFVSAWQASPAHSVAPLSLSDVTAKSKGIEQPLAPVSADSNQAKAAVSSTKAAIAAGALTPSTTMAMTTARNVRSTNVVTVATATTPKPALSGSSVLIPSSVSAAALALTTVLAMLRRGQDC